MNNIKDILEKDSDGVVIGSVEHVVKNPDEYSEEQVKFAKFMKEKFDNHDREVKYDKDGFDVIGGYLKEFIQKEFNI